MEIKTEIRPPAPRQPTIEKSAVISRENDIVELKLTPSCNLLGIQVSENGVVKGIATLCVGRYVGALDMLEPSLRALCTEFLNACGHDSGQE